MFHDSGSHAIQNVMRAGVRPGRKKNTGKDILLPVHQIPVECWDSMKREYTVLLVVVVAAIIASAVWLFFPEPLTYNIFRSVLAILVSYVIFSLILDTAFRRKISDSRTRYTATKVISILEILIIAILVARIWIEDFL